MALLKFGAVGQLEQKLPELVAAVNQQRPIPWECTGVLPRLRHFATTWYSPRFTS